MKRPISATAGCGSKGSGRARATRRIRIIGSSPYEALLIPDTAVATDQSRKIVFVVKEDNMLGVTLFGLIFTPIFYVVVRNLAEGKNEGKLTQALAAAAE